MGITGQVGTATDPAQLIPSLGGFMVLGDTCGTCVCSQGLGTIGKLFKKHALFRPKIANKHQAP